MDHSMQPGNPLCSRCRQATSAVRGQGVLLEIQTQPCTTLIPLESAADQDPHAFLIYIYMMFRSAGLEQEGPGGERRGTQAPTLLPDLFSADCPEICLQLIFTKTAKKH